jgi:translation elongation factor EF-1alpha
MDSCNWSEKRYFEIIDKMKPFLKSCGYKWNSIKHVPVSSQKGFNLLKTFMSKEEKIQRRRDSILKLKELKKIKRDSLLRTKTNKLKIK